MNHYTIKASHVAMKSLLILTLSLEYCLHSFAQTKAEIHQKQYDSSWDSLATYPVPDWLSDAKFGVWVVWGPYSVPAFRERWYDYAEWYPRNLYTKSKSHYPWTKKNYGACPPEFGYKDICRRFEAKNFDPDQWADLFKRSGAKYVLQIAEFHAGFAMWDSELTDWCSTKMGPKRDIVGEVGEAVRKQGMKYGVSYHRERHPGFFAHQPPYAVKANPLKDVAEEIQRDSSAAGLYGPFEYSDAFINDYVARWKELEKKYKPDYLWIDHCPFIQRRANKSYNSPQVAKFRNAYRDMIADYFDSSKKWGKKVYINNKGPAFEYFNFPLNIGLHSMDNLRLSKVSKYPWENPATMSTSYGFSTDEETGNTYKTTQELIQLLCDVISKNGTLLLTVGPKGDGSIPQRQEERLVGIGKWLEVNGEGVYGTRHCTVYGEGEGKAGKVKKYGIPVRPKEIRYTQKGNALFAMSMKKPILPLVLSSTSGYKQADVKGITLLGSNQKIAWEVTDAGIKIDGPTEMKGEHVWVFKIDRTNNKELKATQ